MTYKITDEDRRTAAPPGPRDVGQQRRWVLPLSDAPFDQPVDDVHVFTGKFIGMGSSSRPNHINHDGTEHAPKGVTCSRCRWFEVRIFAEDSGVLTLYYVGKSDVPDEIPLYRMESVVGPLEMIESMTTVRTNGSERKVTLTYAARRALAQAAEHDERVLEAYRLRMQPL